MSLKESDKLIKICYEYFKKMGNYMEIAGEVKDMVLRYWPKAEVYLFGSTVRGEYTASSDIDILIVLDDKPSREEEYMVKAEVYRMVDAPIELHVALKVEFEGLYKKFIGGDIVKI
jgi:predicted nucleotidyltransferase